MAKTLVLLKGQWSFLAETCISGGTRTLDPLVLSMKAKTGDFRMKTLKSLTEHFQYFRFIPLKTILTTWARILLARQSFYLLFFSHFIGCRLPSLVHLSLRRNGYLHTPEELLPRDPIRSTFIYSLSFYVFISVPMPLKENCVFYFWKSIGLKTFYTFKAKELQQVVGIFNVKEWS